MNMPPRPEHEWLHRMIGEWTYEAVTGDVTSSTGRESVKRFGDLWIIGEGEGEMPGAGVGYTRITIGYDTSRQRYAGSWVGSMMSCIFFYEGWRENDTLTLECEGPMFSEDGSFVSDERAMYRDVFTFNGNDQRVLTSQTLADGQWVEFMRATYTRIS